MGALVIWGEEDHKTRAKALATTYNTTAQSVDQKPKKVKGLDTLVFWGHGDTSKFCGKTSGEFVDLIGAWLKSNPELRTVETLTCNARHRQGGHTDSYTEQVVTELGRKNVAKKQGKITFRALPVATAPNGICQFSILKWHPASATWAYVAAIGVDDKRMWAASTKLEDFMPPRGAHVGYARAFVAMNGFQGMTTGHPYATKRNWKQGDVDTYNADLKAVRKDSWIIAGNVGMLRWCLADIR